MIFFVCCFTFTTAAAEQKKEKVDGHVIPVDSKSEWDFRGKVSPFLGGSVAARKLPECKTYEELRDTLKIVYSELDGSGA